MDEPGNKVVVPAYGQLSWSKEINFSYPRSRLRVWSRETGSAVPFRVRLLIRHTQAESGNITFNSAYSRALPRSMRRPFITYLYRQPPSGQSRVYHITQKRTDDVHCRESAGTGPVVFKVIPVTDAAFLQVSSRTNFCAPPFCHTHYNNIII